MAHRALSLTLLAVLAAAARVLAAGGASVEVQVADDAGRVLPDVAASLVSIDEAGALYTVRAGSGTLAFYDVGPGAYRLRVEHPGLAPATTELRLAPGETAWLSAVLARGEGSSRIADPLPQPGGYGTAFDAEALRALPSSRDAWSLLETAENSAVVDRLDNGGLWTGQAPRFNALGVSFAQTSVVFGGGDVSDPFGSGTPLLLPDLGALAGFDAVNAFAPVEAAGSGPLLVLRPLRAGGLWRGTLEGAATPSGLQEDAPAGPPAIARYDSWRRGAFSLAGPLVPGSIGLALAGSATAVSRFERDESQARDGRARSLLAHLTWRGPRQEGRLLGLIQDARRPDPARALFGNAARRDDSFTHLQAGWTRRAAAGAAVQASVAYGRARSSAAGAREAVGTVEPLSDGPIPNMVVGGPGLRQRTAATLTFRAVPRAWRRSWHAVSLGVEAGGEKAELAGSGPITIGERIGGRPARVWEFPARPAPSRWSATELAAHVADRVRIGDRLVVEAGVRLESTRAGGDGPARISWQTVSPRVRARATVDGQGTLAVFGGWARLRDRLSLRLLAFGDPSAPAATVSRWQDDGDRRFTPGEQRRLVAYAGPGGPRSSIDPDLAAPRTDELLAGVEARLGPRVVVRFSGVDRRTRRGIESVNVGVPADRYRTFTVFDVGGDFAQTGDDQQLPIRDRDPASFGEDRYLVRNEDGHGSRYQGVELAVELHPADGVSFRLGATAHRAEGSAAYRGFRSDENDPGLPGELFDNPNADTNANGRLFFDRAYTIKIASWYGRGGRGPRLGAIVRYQDGQPFARLYVASELAQGAEAVRAIPNGRSRFAYTLSLDARAEQGVDVGRVRLSAVAEGFNLLG
ncbi:MAG TPA: carboxypeptidase-like regulatory domain-containing protein, partial [Vicinamibacteria bacterium]|nr:carboxypeptidase-like regulatory domain-containing protein [Vicinamibacteria bacterium]